MSARANAHDGQPPPYAALLLGVMFVAAGALHFVRPRPYERIVPPPLPRRPTVLLSGAAEIACGLGLLIPATRPAASVSLVLLLAAVWPANLHMARQAHRFPRVPAWALWLRLPLQLPLMWWAWLAGRPSRR